MKMTILLFLFVSSIAVYIFPSDFTPIETNSNTFSQGAIDGEKRAESQSFGE